MATLDEIRQKLLAQQNKQDNNKSANGGGDKAVYPFWNIKDNETAVLRFLNDGNPDNTYFWVEKQTIRIPFAGVKGEHDRETIVTVPCMEMYGKQCPIVTETRPWWNDADLKPLAQTYWKKRAYIFQGFVVTDPLNETEVPENPIRRFIINPNLFKAIKTSLMDPDMEDNPTDFANGVDCRVSKSKNGQYSDYTPTWSRKSRPLDETERAAVDQHGLTDLSTFLPKEPTPEEVLIIAQMFKDSVDGLPYDTAKYGNHFKPYTSNNASSAPAGGGSRPAQASKPVQEDDTPFDADPTPSAPRVDEGKAQEASKILEILRSRK